MTKPYESLTAREMSAALAAHEISALELTDAAIARIEALDGPINAVVVRDFDRARDAARAADARLGAGESAPLLGVPMTVKEAFNVAGLPTTWGIAEAKNNIVAEDAVGVQRLKAAGAIILGKTNVPPFLSDWQSVNPIYGRTNNPLDPSRTPGGSSGGSAAALASGMTALEFGSDIGGSIRVPAAFCGVVGHKPSFDLVPQRGHAPPGAVGKSPALGVVGPMARNIGDLSLMFDIVAGPDPDEAVGYRLDLPGPRHEKLSDFRVLMIDHHPLAATDGEIVAALHGLAAQLERQGVQVQRETNLLPNLVESHEVYGQILNTVMSYGAPPGVFGNIIDAHAYMTAEHRQFGLRRQWKRLFEDFDVVIAPVMGVYAFPHDDAPFQERIHVINGVETPYGAQVAWPGVATLANLPATSLRIGTSKSGLPIGMQVIGPYLEDKTCLGFAGLVESLLS
jgi:amidase